MATPLTAAAFAVALRAEGLTIVELDGWATHSRNHRGPWGPVHGVLIHHTGSDTKDPAGYAKNVLYDGYAGLPGPLCQVGIAPDGVVYLTGYGRCNHAGGGDPVVLDAIIADRMPYDSEMTPHRGNADGVDGNSRLYGAEVMYSGGHPMTAAQYDATVRFAAAVCRAHGWTAGSVAGHREWSDDKPDPGRVDLGALRRDVRARLSMSPKEDDMPTPKEVAEATMALDTIPVGSAARAFPGNTNDTLSLRTVLAYLLQQAHAQSLALKALADGMSAEVQAAVAAALAEGVVKVNVNVQGGVDQ
jgi:hypothetical protein